MFKSMGKITAGPIGTKMGTHIGPTDGSGNGHKLKNIGPMRHQGLNRGNIWGFRQSTFHQMSGYDLQEKNYFFFIRNKLKCINNSRTHARTHAHKHARTHTNTHARTHARTLSFAVSTHRVCCRTPVTSVMQYSTSVAAVWI